MKSNGHILWVDDEIDHLKPHILFLEDKGFNISTASNGADAVILIKENNFYSSYWFPATEGRIIMFPSSLYHSVKPNQSGLERISVSFNITLSTDT